MNTYRFLTASHIWPMAGTLPDQPVLVFEKNRLTDILSRKEIDPLKIEKYNGTLIPGFVNAHCHLELSHMKGKVPSGTGLTPFLHAVVTQDPVDESIIIEEVSRADQEMRDGGIVAVGDISNLPHTGATKVDSPIEYYTFVEMFDFLDPGKADQFFGQYESVYQIFRKHGLQNVSRVPHSTYTVSQKLMEKLSNALSPAVTGSIHMLENEQEDRLLMGQVSEYQDFFHGLGFGLDHFQPPGNTSMERFMDCGYRPDRLLFIHNTIACESDLAIMRQYNETREAYLVTCPNANLYIESRLPDYDLWKRSGLPICIGTDSYASNYQLSVWNEICTIKSHNDSISWEELIRWGTLHGARGLGMEENLGSLEVGKSPGVVLLEHGDDEQLDSGAIPRKIL